MFRKKAVKNSDTFKSGIDSKDDIKEQDLGSDSHQYKRMGGFELFPAAKVRDSDWISVVIYVVIYLLIGLGILIFVDMYFNGKSLSDMFNF